MYLWQFGADFPLTKMPFHAARGTRTARKRPISGASYKSASSVAKKALREVRKLASTREVKRLDLSLGNADLLAYSLNGYLTNIAPIAQGAGTTERIGDTVRLKKCTVIGTMNSANASNFCYRWLLIRDKQTRASYTPSVSEIMSSARTNAVMLESKTSQYEILYDKIVDTNVNFTNQDTRNTIRFEVPLDITMEFNSTTSTSFQRNNVYLVMLCEMGSTTQYTALVGGEGFFGYYMTTTYTDA